MITAKFEMSFALIKKPIIIILSFIFAITFSGCDLKKEYLFCGKTMGTTYNIKVVSSVFKNPANLKGKIDKKLFEVNKSMSTYIKDSEISVFNADLSIEKKHYISPDFFYVMAVADNLYHLTNGAWDGTVKPLVDLWGFGIHEQKNKIPDKNKISEILDTIGFDKIEISDKGYLKKKIHSITLDLASIAKGYAVDRVSDLIRSNGISDFLVEIGGEVYASGLSGKGKPWIVGINTPLKDAPPDSVYARVALQDKAMATSGDYRNFFEIDGVRYSHIIDPKTGNPVKNNVVSASVISSSCTFADGLATALMVLGQKKGIDLAKSLKDAQCLIIVQDKDGALKDYYSGKFGN
jgi:thiamine biosynthesis lipoprotein